MLDVLADILQRLQRLVAQLRGGLGRIQRCRDLRDFLDNLRQRVRTALA
ncbi:MAG: hypothetical protein IPJ33_05740 [Gammaproteobacteria bacterium]|nr:hypothetical protein [Gammaproteobacteria bacterium]